MTFTPLAPTLRVEVVETTPSTNALAAERARAGAAEGLVVVAEHQTAGRGRLDRAWVTPPRSALAFSVVLRPDVAPAQWPWLPLLTGLSVATVLRARGYDAGVKWPNDVLIGESTAGPGRGRKAVGILVERVETPTGAAAVVGIGLNVSQTAAELPVPTGTSLAIESGESPDRGELLAALLTHLWSEYDAWRTGGAEARQRLRTAYAGGCVTLGLDVRVVLPGEEELRGRATGIDETGRLVVAGPHGTSAVGAGDVVHVRLLEVT